jgi:DNA-directed RNA polymerase subunit RPC12/RpoP
MGKAAQPFRTDLYCHNCCKNFVAELDVSVDGDHVIECPYCAHEHCRVVKAGKVTEVRWETRAQRQNIIKVDRRSVWKAGDTPIQTSSASSFIRDRWLDKMSKQ